MNQLDKVKIEAGDTFIILSNDEFYSKYQDSVDHFFMVIRYLFFYNIRCDVPPESKSLIINIKGYKLNLWWYQYLTYVFFTIMIIVGILSSLLKFGWSLARMGLIVSCLNIIFRLISVKDTMKSININIIILISSSISIGIAIINSGLAYGVVFYLFIDYRGK
jgi:hypothetical protein